MYVHKYKTVNTVSMHSKKAGDGIYKENLVWPDYSFLSVEIYCNGQYSIYKA